MQGQPQYYASQQPQQPVRQPQNNGVNVQDVKAGLTDAAQNIVGKAKKGFKNKKIFGGIVAAVAILAIICVVGWLFGNNNGFVATKAHITPIVVDGEVRIMVDNKLLEDTIDGKSVDAGSSSLNGKVVAFTTDENILYVVNGKKVTKVAEDVLSCQVSTSGKGVAYLTDADEGYSLNLYKVSGGKDTKVSDDVGSYSFAISPDGKSVAYFVDGDDHNELMYFKGSESVKIASEEVALLGLSNSGKQIYVTRKDDNGENIVYSYNTKGEKEKLGKTDDYAVYFNEKHTEIMFFNEGKTYIAAKGKEGVKMSSDELHLVVAPNASTNSDGAAYTYPVSSLFNHVYLSRDDDGMNAWMIKKNPDKNVKLASDVSNVTLDKSGKYLYYVHDGEELMVLKVSDGDKASNKAVELADDVSTYVVESGRGKVYYVSDGELYSVNGKKGGKPKEIADEIDGYSLAISAKNVVFYISDGDLYACSNGKSGERALSDCSAVSNTCNGVIYAIDDDAIYASKGSKKVEKVAELDS
jgi:dipeptidyl aminopeptidase/acylaminoacyl peptidase